GLLSASFPIAQLASSPVWGRVSDRYGRRPALLVGLSASAIAYVIFGFAGSLWLLFVSRFVQGLGGGTTGVAQAYVADTVAPPEPRPVREALWEVVRHPGRPAAHLIWIYAVAMLAYNATPPVFALYLSGKFGITERNIGYFFLIFGGVGVLMRAFAVGWVN